ncbi:MAG TPA: hypothetical protein ENJ18_10015, partial [Nannocystis exedens]|nr:hypothetical protein [Nannocystis exedens]
MEDPGLRILGNLHGLHMCDEGIAGFRGGPDHPGGELVFFDPQGVVERRISLAEVEERAGLTLIDRHTLAVAYPYKHRNRGEVRLMSLAGTPQVTQVIRCDQPTVYSLGTVLRAGGDTLVI